MIFTTKTKKSGEMLTTSSHKPITMEITPVKKDKVRISIYKNGVEIRYRIVREKEVQSHFEDMFDMAGGMYNGKDTFTIRVNPIE